MEELLSLKWNNHRSTFLHILTVLRDKQLYTDATLACEGRFYSVHRLVLSTCSDYFSAMFDRTTCKNPIIVLKDIKCEDLEALLDYMYLGEVNVRQADLASLIKAAECLRVKGLAVPDDEPPPRRGRGGDGGSSRRPEGAGSPPAKRKRREEGQDGREDVRPRPSTTSTVRSPQLSSRLSPGLPDGGEPTGSNASPGPGDVQGNDTPHLQSSLDEHSTFVKVEQEEQPVDDMGGGGPGDTFDLPNDGYKEEHEDNDAGDPGGDMSNDLPEFLQQATGSHMGATSFSHGSFPGTSSYQSGDLGWQGEGSNLNFPGHLNYSSSTETSSQNAPLGSVYGEANHPAAFAQGIAGRQPASSWDMPSLQCVVCKKTFHGRNRKQNLKNHSLIHTGYKEYACPLCSYSALHKWHLKGHLLRRHGEAATFPPPLLNSSSD